MRQWRRGHPNGRTKINILKTLKCVQSSYGTSFDVRHYYEWYRYWWAARVCALFRCTPFPFCCCCCCSFCIISKATGTRISHINRHRRNIHQQWPTTKLCANYNDSTKIVVDLCLHVHNVIISFASITIWATQKTGSTISIFCVSVFSSASLSLPLFSLLFIHSGHLPRFDCRSKYGKTEDVVRFSTDSFLSFFIFFFSSFNGRVVIVCVVAFFALTSACLAEDEFHIRRMEVHIIVCRHWYIHTTT